MLNFFKLLVAGASVIIAPSLVHGQSCAVPQSLPAPRVETPPPGSARAVPVTGLILALSWSPQFCKSRGGGGKFATQCDKRQNFGFILHGLWPDASGPQEPRWCRRVGVLPRELIRQNFCATPSAQLQQHEWAKHGSCIDADPVRYFGNAGRMFANVKIPDMDALSRRPAVVGDLTAALLALNPWLKRDAIGVRLSERGWLEELRICYNKDYRVAACPGGERGADPDSKMRIWRNER